MFRIALLGIIVATLIPNLAGAAYGSVNFCNQIVGPSTVLSGGAGSGPVAAVNTILIISLLILLVMLNIAALVYLVGSAFRIGRLVQFGRTEIGEVLLTIVVVFIFIGSFAAVDTLPLSNNFLALSPGTLSQGIFSADCNYLAAASLNALGNIVPIFAAENVVTFAQSLTFSFTWSGLGASASPYAGFSISLIMLNNVANIAYLFIGLPLAGAAIIGIFFAIAPIFLYLGIILRTIPFTRAAGGAFLGLFIAFYVLFPLLIYLLITQVSPCTSPVTPTGQCISFSTYSTGTLFNNVGPGITWAPSYSDLGFGLAIEFVETVISQVFYVVFAFILALIISFDFMEAAGDVLGAPSLSSSQTLRKLI